jgi:DNA-binding response OmpR family regulator
VKGFPQVKDFGRILIISADPTLSVLLEASLRMRDYQVELTGDGFTGFQKILMQRPGVIIVDAALPRMSGYQLVEKLKRSADLAKIPVIVTSDSVRFRYLFDEQEVACFLRKPVIPSELFRKVETLLHKREVRKTAAFKREIPPGAKKALVAGVQDYYLEKISNHLQQRQYYVEMGWNEEDVVDKAAALQPDIVVLQHWESADTFDCRMIWKALRTGKLKTGVFIVIFCDHRLTREAESTYARTPVIGFTESPQLLEQLGKILTKNSF